MTVEIEKVDDCVRLRLSSGDTNVLNTDVLSET
jgi:hypothetical protein